MVKAYSRYEDSGAFGRIHVEGVGKTVSWSSSGKSLFSAVGTEILEINVKTGAVVGATSCSKKVQDESLYGSALSLHQPARVSCLESSGEYLGIGCTDGSIRIQELPLGSEDKRAISFQGHRGSVNAVAFSVGSSGLVATGGRDTEIVVWDLVGESGICRLTGHKGEVTSLRFLPDNADFLVSGSKDGVVKIWSVKLQICVQTITEPKSEVWSLAFHGQRLLVGSADKVLHVYSIRSNLVIDASGLTVADFHGQLDRPEPSDGRIMDIAVSSNNFLFAQTDRRVIEIWRVVADEGEKTKRMKRRVKRRENFQDDDEKNNSFFTANDEYVIAASPENPSVALRYVSGSSRVKSMSVFSNSVALGLGDNQIEIVNFSAGGEIIESKNIKREGHRNSVSRVVVSWDGSRIVSVSSESIIVWNCISLTFQRTILSPSGEVLDAFFVPRDADKLILICRDGHVCVVDLNSGSVVGDPFLVGPSENSSILVRKRKSAEQLLELKCAFMYIQDDQDRGGSSFRLLLGDKSRRISVLEGGVGGELKNIAIHEIPDEPVCMCVSPASKKYIAVGLLNSNIELIYADSGKHYMSLYAHKLAVSALCFSPDDQVVVSGSSDKNIKIWSVKFGNVLKSIRAHDSAITSLLFIPHSHLVFSASRDGVLSLWDIDRFERVMSKVLHPGSEVLSIAASSDAGMVFSSGTDGSIKRITRSEDQMFIEDEAEKAMEMDVDREAQRDDLLGGGENKASLPTRSSLESVRMLDKVIQMIEIDEDDENSILDKKKALVKFVSTELPPSDLQQVIVTLPTGHARRLLAIIAEVMESVLHTVPNIDNKTTRTLAFPLGFPVEQCVSAGLFLIQAQAKYLIGEPHSRPVLIKLKELFHLAIRAEIENVGIASATVRLL